MGIFTSIHKTDTKKTYTQSYNLWSTQYVGFIPTAHSKHTLEAVGNGVATLIA